VFKVIIILTCFLLGALLYHEKKKDQKKALVTKSLLSFLFVITVLLQPHPIPTYYHFLLAGLMLCFIGDVCLALSGDKIFQVGLVVFLLGHVFYIFSFLSRIKFSLWISSDAFIIFAVSTLIFLWLRPHLKSMLVPVLVYILVISLMLCGAWAVFQKSPFPVLGRTFIFTGAFCFYLSDICVARDRFIKNEYRNRLIGLPLYYLGQFLLAFSAGL
jgi:uncharacterized membrane protein YhhN